MSEQKNLIDLEQFKAQLLELMKNKYLSFMNELLNFPLDELMRDKAIHSFDTGFLWIREALLMAKLATHPVAPPAEQPETPAEEKAENENTELQRESNTPV